MQIFNILMRSTFESINLSHYPCWRTNNSRTSKHFVFLLAARNYAKIAAKFCFSARLLTYLALGMLGIRYMRYFLTLFFFNVYNFISTFLPAPRKLRFRRCLSVCLSASKFAQKLPNGFA